MTKSTRLVYAFARYSEEDLTTDIVGSFNAAIQRIKTQCLSEDFIKHSRKRSAKIKTITPNTDSMYIGGNNWHVRINRAEGTISVELPEYIDAGDVYMQVDRYPVKVSKKPT